MADADRQRQMAVFVVHVEELQPPAIGGGVELEVHGPHLMGTFGFMTQAEYLTGRRPLLCSRGKALGHFLAPEAVYQRVMHPQPSHRSTRYAFRLPQRICPVAISRRSHRTFCTSISTILHARRRLLRCMPTILQANCTETRTWSSGL